MNAQYSKLHTRTLTRVALMTAVLCILGPLAIPIPMSPVPISLIQIGVYLAIYTTNYKEATLSTLLFLLIGGLGLPVFSGFSGGLGKLFGPTGGYLIGFVFLALIAGYFIDTYRGNKGLCILGLVLGNLACYLLGTLWLAHVAQLGLVAALSAGVLPYVLGDVVKAAGALVFGDALRKRVRGKSV